MRKIAARINGLCTREEIAEAFGSTANNITKTYIDSPNKKKAPLKKNAITVLNLGSYCFLNDISPKKLLLYAEYGEKLLKAIMEGGYTSDEKIVVMSPEELEELNQFKKFQQYQKSK